MEHSIITLDGNIQSFEWYTAPNVVHLFIHLLLIANHKEKKWQGSVINRGQIVTGRSGLAIETGLSESKIRTALEKLESTKEITVVTTNKYSVITICNYDNYQLNKIDE